MQLWKLGCRWSGATPLFYDFIKEHQIVIGWFDKDYQVGDWLLITNGHTVLSLAKVLAKRKTILDFPDWEEAVKKLGIPFEQNLYVYEAKFLNLREADRFIYPLQQGIVRVQDDKYLQIFKQVRAKYMGEASLSGHLDLLHYKKQIILQGPPGTGKTKLAKELAEALIEEKGTSLSKPDHISAEDIRKYVKVGDSIGSVMERAIYKVKAIQNVNLVLSNGEKKDAVSSFKRIMFFYKDKNWDRGLQKRGFDPYDAAIAKYIYEKIEPVASPAKVEASDQFKLIQFHPGYSYEDFVRGIVAEPHGDGIAYRNINKILGSFAKKANDNFELSRQDNLHVQQSKWIEEAFEEFKGGVETEVEEKKLTLSGNIQIFKVENDCFKYGESWSTPSRINFDEVKKLIGFVLNGELDIEQNEIPKALSVHAHFRQTYYLQLLRRFFKEFSFEPSNEKEGLRNYVLIIDEINRANLSSVLGELIYALEYRGEKVDSMYAVEGDHQLVLPPNLYIIGTMNTADRSVGHIDYAIRRRFAFADVLPKDLSAELGAGFHQALYLQVSELFVNYLSPEFERKDVQLGHSYFIDKSANKGSMQVRLQYEIRPILLEYVKDGILTGEGILQQINNLVA